MKDRSDGWNGPGPYPTKLLDERGRCCGRKPLFYKRPTDPRVGSPHLFCYRCDRAFSMETGSQIENWAWKKDVGGMWIKR